MIVHSMMIYSCHHTHDQKSQADEGEGCLLLHRVLRKTVALPLGSQANSHPWMRTWLLCHGQALPLFSIHTLVDQLSPSKKEPWHAHLGSGFLVVQLLVQPLVKSIGCITHWPVQRLNAAGKDQISSLTPALSGTCHAAPPRTHLRSD